MIQPVNPTECQMPLTRYPLPPPLRTGDVNIAALVTLQLDESRLHPSTHHPQQVDCFGCLDAPSWLPGGSCLSMPECNPWQREVVR